MFIALIQALYVVEIANQLIVGIRKLCNLLRHEFQNVRRIRILLQQNEHLCLIKHQEHGVAVISTLIPDDLIGLLHPVIRIHQAAFVIQIIMHQGRGLLPRIIIIQCASDFDIYHNRDHKFLCGGTQSDLRVIPARMQTVFHNGNREIINTAHKIITRDDPFAERDEGIRNRCFDLEVALIHDLHIQLHDGIFGDIGNSNHFRCNGKRGRILFSGRNQKFFCRYFLVLSKLKRFFQYVVHAVTLLFPVL